MLYLTVVEPGDVIAVYPPGQGAPRAEDIRYYILTNEGLAEVEWYFADQYQAPFRADLNWVAARPQGGSKLPRLGL